MATNFIDCFGGRLWYACPDGWSIYTHRGRDYHLGKAIADPEAVMKASLEQRKNFPISTFLAVELYPDPTCDY